MKDFVNELLPLMTLILGITIVIYFVLLIIEKLTKTKFLDYLLSEVKKKSVFWMFLIALVSTLGSLFYSEIMGYNPCKLCWFQRIMMYPLVVFFGMALIKKRKDFVDFVWPLVGLGILTSGYHYLTQLMQWKTSCSALESAADCTLKFIFNYGYITIPMMAFTGFVGIAILLWWNRN